MPNQLKRLAEIVAVNPDSWSRKLYWPKIQYLDTKNITQGRIDKIVSFNIESDRIPIRARRMVKNGDIVYSTVRPNQLHFGILRNIPKNLLVSTGFVVLRNIRPRDFDLRYIYHLITQKSLVDYLQGIAESNTSTYPSLRPNDLIDLEFSFPPIGQQKSVCDFIELIDSKIEINRQMNETLEEMAKTIFKSWFVDFDPVRAKMNRQSTGLRDEISNLFPSKMVDSEVGEIPEGWETNELGKNVIPRKGKSITKSRTVVGKVPVVAGGLEPAYYHNKSNVSAPVTTISASGANAGFVRLYLQDIWASDCSYLSKEQTDIPFFWYIFLKLNEKRLYHMQHGDAQPHIYPSDLMRLNVVLPKNSNLKKKFDEVSAPMFERIAISQREIVILGNLRDKLLPKLISGELRIRDAEKFLERAGV